MKWQKWALLFIFILQIHTLILQSEDARECLGYNYKQVRISLTYNSTHRYQEENLYKIKSKIYGANKLIPLVPRRMVLTGKCSTRLVLSRKGIQYTFLTDYIHLNMYKVGTY